MVSKKTKKYYNLAQAASELSDYTRVKIGAAIIKDGDIIAVGFNSTKTHPIQKKYNVYRGFNDELNSFLHAEMSVIVKSKNQDLRGASIYISRKTQDGLLAICRPCAACMMAIKDSGIENVFYTSEEGYERLTFH